MDPKLAQNLDPKLKETYDRIMGTQINPQPGTPVPAVPQPVQTPTPTPQFQTQPQTPTQTAEQQVPVSPQPGMVNINATVAQAKPVASAASKKKMSPVIFIAAGIGFFLIYTVIWLKVFKIF